MKKRSLVLFAGVAAAATVALASCGENAKSSTAAASSSALPTYEAGSRLDVSVSYDGSYGFVDARENFANPVDGQNYKNDGSSLLPVWKAYGEKLNVNIKNAYKHASGKATANYATDVTNQFKSTVGGSEAEYIDLYYNQISNINAMGAEGNAVDLMPYVQAGYMPNLKAFLEKYPAIAKQMMVGEALYHTPYFDGYNNIKREIQMDGTIVKRVLDGTPAFDTAATTIPAKFQPFVGDANSNYKADTKIKVSVNGKAKEVTVKKTTNIIAEQNKLLAAGTTGKALGDQYVAYLKTAYANLLADGTITKLSDIFLSEAACYNTDDLIALMRVVKANPTLVTEGNANAPVYPLIVREQKTGRVDAIYRWMGEVFGIQGLGAEKDYNFYGADGKLYDATTTKATYEGLDLMAQLYEEGLIQTNFWLKSSSVTTTYAKAYFGRTVKDNLGYALMEHDYTATQSAFNALDDTKIGTSNATINNATRCELQPILAPLTYWATESYDHDAALTARTGKTLERYYEENRTLKTDSWCIPTNSDNKLAAVALMDYVLSDEGQILTDFGPESYWAKDAAGAYTKVTFGGQTTVQLSSATLTWFGDVGGDYWKFCRDKIGASDAIGYVRTATLDYQVTNGIARNGAMSLSQAIAAGVQLTCTNKSTYKFGECAPASGLATVTTDNGKKYAAITAFWGEAYSDKAKGWAMYIADANRATAVLGKDAQDTDYTITTVKGQFAAKDTNYLYFITQDMKDTMGIDAIPAYLKK